MNAYRCDGCREFREHEPVFAVVPHSRHPDVYHACSWRCVGLIAEARTPPPADTLADWAGRTFVSGVEERALLEHELPDCLDAAQHRGPFRQHDGVESCTHCNAHLPIEGSNT